MVDEQDRSDDESDIDTVREAVGRRELLGGAAALIIGTAYVINERDYTELDQAEAHFIELSNTIDSRDLADPLNVLELHREVTGTVESVNEKLAEVDPDRPEIHQRLSMLETVRNYYSALADVLVISKSLQREIDDIESSVLDDEGPFETSLSNDVDLSSLNRSISELSAIDLEARSGTSDDSDLVPNPQGVRGSLRTQHEIFDQHITALQIYLDTGSPIEAGIRAHEKTHFDIARSILIDARETLSAGIPTKVRYRVSPSSLSLEQYVQILQYRRDGVMKALSASRESTPVDQRRTKLNNALDSFFEARGIVVNR